MSCKNNIARALSYGGRYRVEAYRASTCLAPQTKEGRPPMPGMRTAITLAILAATAIALVALRAVIWMPARSV